MPADRLLTLMAVHAHPDDEATGTGGTLARYASEGVRTVLVTCTDGRCGDGPGGVKPGEPGHDPEAVVAARQRELEESCRALGVSDLELLGYPDSGMMGWPTNDAPGSFWSTPVDVAAERLADLMRHYQPDVVVTYDENGFYGHPDHIQAHRITMAAVASSGVPAKVYWTTVPRSQFARFIDLMQEFAPESSADDDRSLEEQREEMQQWGLEDDAVTTWLDVSAFAGQKFDALEAHASQGENIVFLQMGRERFAEMMSMETYVRVQDSTGAPTPEDDLFAGLR